MNMPRHMCIHSEVSKTNYAVAININKETNIVTKGTSAIVSHLFMNMT